MELALQFLFQVVIFGSKDGVFGYNAGIRKSVVGVGDGGLIDGLIFFLFFGKFFIFTTLGGYGSGIPSAAAEFSLGVMGAEGALSEVVCGFVHVL